LNLGGGTGKAHLSVNFESSGETSSSSGIFIGSSVATTVNIRNGYRLRGEGNYNVIGTTHNAHRYATVNVYNGAFVEDTGYQYEDFLYGFSIGDGRMYNGKSEEVKGVLNIYPDGVVSNIAKIGITAAGSGVYLRLGSGKLSKGIINQYGGKLYLSAYAVPKHGKNIANSHDEISYILEKIWKMHDDAETVEGGGITHNGLYMSIETLVDDLRENYTAVLLVCDAESGLPDEFYSVEGSVCGELALSENGKMLWETQYIYEAYYSPATSSFSIGGASVVYKHTFDEQGKLVNTEKTDEIVDFRR
jgi:hypothetical protein